MSPLVCISACGGRPRGRVRWPTKLPRGSPLWDLESALFLRRISATRASCTTLTRAMLLWHSKMASCGLGVCPRRGLCGVCRALCEVERARSPHRPPWLYGEVCRPPRIFLSQPHAAPPRVAHTRSHVWPCKTGTGACMGPGTSEATINRPCFRVEATIGSSQGGHILISTQHATTGVCIVSRNPITPPLFFFYSKHLLLLRAICIPLLFSSQP